MLSMRSNVPPWPSIMRPQSLTPRSRLPPRVGEQITPEKFTPRHRGEPSSSNGDQSSAIEASSGHPPKVALRFDLLPRETLVSQQRHFEPVSGVSNPVSLGGRAGGCGKRKVAP